MEMLRLSYDDYINYQSNDECALITVLNAYQYLYQKKLTYPQIAIYTAKYMTEDGMLDFKRKAAMIDELGMKIRKESNDFIDMKITNNYYDFTLPVEMGIQTRGANPMKHSILIIDYIPQYDMFQVTNFLRRTTKKGYIFEEDLFLYEPKSPEGRVYIAYQKK